MNILDKSYKSNIEELKNKVITGQTESISWRIQQIRKVSQLLDENKKEIIKALFLDLGKSELEALSEILLIIEEISLIKKNLRLWMRPKKVKTPIYLCLLYTSPSPRDRG